MPSARVRRCSTNRRSGSCRPILRDICRARDALRGRRDVAAPPQGGGATVAARRGRQGLDAAQLFRHRRHDARLRADRSIHKQGHHMPGVGIPIVDAKNWPGAARLHCCSSGTSPARCCAAGRLPTARGRFIVPIPHVQVLCAVRPRPSTAPGVRAEPSVDHRGAFVRFACERTLTARLVGHFVQTSLDRPPPRDACAACTIRRPRTTR